NKSTRIAQKALAYEVTKLVHGAERAESVQRISEVLFGSGTYEDLTEDDFAQLKQELPATDVISLETTVVDALVDSRLASSKGEARRFVEAGAVYINGSQIAPDKLVFDDHDMRAGHAIMRRGKNTSTVLTFI